MILGVNTLFMVPGDVGGTETYLRRNLLALTEEIQDTEIILFTNRENDALFRRELAGRENVAFHRLNFRAGSRPHRILAEQFWLPWSVKKKNISLLWSPGYTAPLYTHCAQVVTVHDLQYKVHPEDLSFIERFMLNFLVKSACRMCNEVIAVSEFAKSEIVRYRFAEGERVHVVLEGVESEFEESVPLEVKSEIVETILPGNPPFILCVAHAYPHKNVDLLVDAFRLVRHEIPHTLVLVGKARLGERKLQESLGRLEDKNRVVRIGNGLPFNMLKVLYQEADLFVLPSGYEGFGLPVLESMMAGTPVLISRNASLPEVGGESALYVDPLTAENLAEQIIHFFALPLQERKQLIENGKTWASSFSWKRSAHQTAQVFYQAVNRQK